MTREEEIQYHAEKYEENWNSFGEWEQPTLREAYEDGALWADKHPKSPWISVEDRLPEDGEYALVYNKGMMVEYLHYFVGFWRNSKGEKMFPQPTHWMPIPETPKGDEK